MKKCAVRTTVAVMSLALAAGVALADSGSADTVKKKGFFARLFSGTSSTSTVKSRRSQQSAGWWNGKNNDIRIIYGMGNEADITLSAGASDGDPEVAPGYGMGNLTYVPDKLASLGGNTFSDSRPTGDLETALYDALSDQELAIATLPQLRDVIVDNYHQRGFHPLWIEEGKVSPRGRAVLDVLAAAADEGLQPANYLPADLGDFAAAGNLGSADPSTLARVDLEMTVAAMRYAYDLSGGRYDPERLSRYHDIAPVHVAADTAIKVLAWSPYPGTYLQSLEPQHPAYAAMKKALASLRATVGDVTNFVTIDTGARVKLGDSDDRLVDIRDRLASLGHGVAATGDPAVLDEDLAAALKAFQAEKGVKPTGNLDDATVAALNGQGGELNIHRLVDNMERLRWLPKDLGYRHVFVNQAAFEVRVMEGSNEIWKSKVIVGKPTTQTEVFDDQIEMVVFNPSWGVPPSIIANEYLPKLRVDPSYLDRIGFKVSTVNGDTVSSSDIDWNSYGSKVPFNVEQPPGSGNALGELKFLFPNAHNIYMHDTPQRELFSRSERAFSHGCVRVQNPREFATILLGWNRAKVDSNTDSRRSQTVRLPKPVPIHLAYFTAWPAADGSITYYRDIYGRDETLEKAMSATILAQR